MLISFLSAKGSPGVTTAVLALASQWPRTAVVVDADPAGGDIAAGLGRGSWPSGASLTDLVVDMRVASADAALRRRAIKLADHCPLALAGIGSPDQAPAVPWERLATELGSITDADILIDCGRFSPHDQTAHLVRNSDQVILVTGSTLRSARSSVRMVAVIDAVAGRPEHFGVLVVGPDQPYSPDELADSCQLPLIGSLPYDERAARTWTDGERPGRWFGRSPLQREARLYARTIASTVPATASESYR